jgi:hypothetical protein
MDNLKVWLVGGTTIEHAAIKALKTNNGIKGQTEIH